MGCVCCLAGSLVRMILFAFNVIFVICGIALMALGIMYLVEFNHYKELVKGEGVEVAPILCIVVGVVVFIIAFLGCYGALVHHKCMLKTYAVILLVLLVLQLTVCAVAFKKLTDNDLKNTVEKRWETYVNEFYNGTLERMALVEKAQKAMKCCGNTNYTDYALQNNLPKSCCGLEPDSQTPCTDGHEGLIKQGCKSEIGSAIDLVNKVLGFFGLFIVIILACGIAFSLCLACQ